MSEAISFRLQRYHPGGSGGPSRHGVLDGHFGNPPSTHLDGDWARDAGVEKFAASCYQRLPS